MTDGSVTKLGTIDVAVSDTQNTPPVALNYVREGKLDKGMLVTIDLTDYISDAEDVVIPNPLGLTTRRRKLRPHLSIPLLFVPQSQEHMKLLTPLMMVAVDTRLDKFILK
ncbi:hypothetical protein D0856_07885 [Vibrio owensii]|nr:hypothetical protein D0856_07885 [Vibrio owensii]